ncbi:MAG: NAD(P)/FAD-dependent oxidoreductase [Anaerolineae bacterium]|nr:NAD(P)/FAD-dependent oxidoreductase [Anaerolineae bacterium]
MQTDVAIIGAGPAGSIAAQRLAAAGVRVVLLEQEVFPRDKPCGDGVTARGLKVLERSGLAGWLERFPAPRVGRMSAPDGQIVELRLHPDDRHCYGRTIPRRLLDERLAQAAVEAGARLMEGIRVREIGPAGRGGRHIRADGLQITATLVILADGSLAPLTRRLGLTTSPPEMLAVRRYFTGDVGPQDRLEIHFRPHIVPGYAWIFPLGEDRVNVGVGTFRQRMHQESIRLRNVLDEFIANAALTEGRLERAEPAGPLQGHPLRTQLGKTRTHDERILVAGDAAGLVNPLSGEGIAPALESGALAASCALDALATGDCSARTLAAYTRALIARFAADYRAAWLLRQILGVPRLLSRIFSRLRQDADLALLVGHVMIGHLSPRMALRPRTLLRLFLT